MAFAENRGDILQSVVHEVKMFVHLCAIRFPARHHQDSRGSRFHRLPYAGGGFHQRLIKVLVVRRDKEFGVMVDDNRKTGWMRVAEDFSGSIYSLVSQNRLFCIQIKLRI